VTRNQNAAFPGGRATFFVKSCCTRVDESFTAVQTQRVQQGSMRERNNTAVIKCVSCASTRVRRSPWRGFSERLFLQLVGLHPFHCVDCYKRFYSRTQPIRVERHEPEIMARTPEPVQDQRTEEKKIPVRLNQEERRSFSRLVCRIAARVEAGPVLSTAGVVSSISLNGCFIETPRAVPTGCEIELTLEIGERTRVRGLVRTSLPATGIGIEFTDMTVPNFRRLRSIARDSVRLETDL
jgi:hypothetical protein